MPSNTNNSSSAPTRVGSTADKQGIITKVSGPLVVASGMKGAKMYDVVRVSEQRLVGEIIELEGDHASIQVYEETAGIGPGMPVYLTNEPLSVELGPGILKNFYDGVQRPLEAIAQAAGDFITRGIDVPSLDRSIKWEFIPQVKKGDKVGEGDVLGTVQETNIITHKIMVPPGLNGTVEKIQAGAYTVTETIACVAGQDVQMMQKWSIRKARPVKQKLAPEIPLITGQRVFDTFFPIAKGGTGCVPGPFGAGKTVIQQQLAKWADADVIVYIGCGERGNEMTDVLIEFPELEDPKSGKPLMERTVLIANTSNMPVAAREASVYTGITIAEYFRDMGYDVALMADSTSRWAEAMREMSGRLEEMPGEEGYPAYLGSRTAAFYERAGRVQTLGRDDRTGSLTVIGAVSPPGGDLSEPVTQNTLRVVKVFWGLEAKLASQRHFFAVNWLTSYSLYTQDIVSFMDSRAGSNWNDLRQRAMEILQQEAKLEEIVQLVGLDALSYHEQLVLQTARSLREDFLRQNAYDEVDTYTSLKKQYLMLKSILTFHEVATETLDSGKPLSEILELPVRETIARLATEVRENELEKIERLIEDIKKEIQ